MTTITVRLDDVLVFGNEGLRPEPGYCVHTNTMTFQCMELPPATPPIARGACKVLRAYGEFTRQQMQCLQACVDELGGVEAMT